MEDPAQDAERDARLTPETASPPENKEDKVGLCSNERTEESGQTVQ